MHLYLIDAGPVSDEGPHEYVSRAVVCAADPDWAVSTLLSVIRGNRLYAGKQFCGRVARPDLRGVEFDEDNYEVVLLGETSARIRALVSLETKQTD